MPTRSGDHAIREAKTGGTPSGPIEDQQLVPEEYGFGNHGPRAARISQSGDRRQQMQKQDGEIAHRTIVSRSRHRKNGHEFCNSPSTSAKRPRAAARSAGGAVHEMQARHWSAMRCAFEFHE